MTPLLSFDRVGQGPHRVMVLGGWLGVAQDWEAVHGALDTEAFTFLFMDYRGYGESRSVAGEYTFDEIAQDVIRLADSLRWNNFSLVGHSMGGMAMQRAYLVAPERIERMVAVCAVPACGSRMPAERLAFFRDAVNDVSTLASIVDASTGKRLPACWTRARAQQTGGQLMPAAMESYLMQWAQSGFEQALGQPTLPVKLLVGQHDPTLTAALMERTWQAWYPRAELEVLTGCGHYPMLETPLALAATMQEFLRREPA